jgi:hypothetical protein
MKEFFKKYKKLIIIGVFVLVLVVGLILLILHFKKSGGNKLSAPPPPPPVPDADVKVIDDPRMFFCPCSTDHNVGRDIYGNYVDKSKNPTVILEKGFATDDINGPSELAKYPLTYGIGHPYYNQKTFGYLYGKSWKVHVVSTAIPLDYYIKTDNTKDLVLIIEGGTGNNTYSPVYINKSMQFKGIVVRHNGVLFIQDGNDIDLRVEFMLIESGGLLQAGSHYRGLDDADYRFKNKLNIILTNPPEGYGHMGVVASQYSYSVYNPGVTDPNYSGPDLNDKLMTTFTGDTDFTNEFGAKCIAVGFNGNYQLCGSVGNKLPYEGTWNATSDDSVFLGKDQIMSIVDDEDMAKIVNIETGYPNVWCRLSDGIYNSGQNTIKLDSRDINNCLSEWKPGYKIVITCKSKTFCSQDDPVGMPPIWLDHTDDANKNANQIDNDRYTNSFPKSVDKTDGVEVATIQSISSDGTITLERPLKYRHDSTRIQLTRQSTQKTNTIKIDTNLHVGLLTRNIVITSEFQTTKEENPGCNRWWKDVKERYDTSSFIGPPGSVVCNYNYSGQPGNDISQLCYDPRKSGVDVSSHFCSDKKPGPAQGSWMFGTAGLKGCNAIHGGQQMFRYGSSVRLDGVEVRYMGTPGNFGSIGQYGIHFHLSGFIKSFRGYLMGETKYGQPKEDDILFRREGEILNNSIWCMFSRWVTTHGTHEANIKNNVGFVCYGSGYFVEDGTEIDNTFEHNTAICCLTANKNDYWNQIPIYPNVGSDIALSSSFWFKNNQNRCFRNLACNSPVPVIGIWAVPQNIYALRGPSAVCIGDEKLGLPAIASSFNATGWQPPVGLSKNGNSNRGGKIKLFSKSPLTNNVTSCWVPDYFYTEKALVDEQRCPAYSNNNSYNPYQLCSENIFYCILSAFSEFPEALSNPIGNYYGINDYGIGTNNGPYIGVKKGLSQPQFIPINGQNSCTDEHLTQATYFPTIWGGNRNDAGNVGKPYVFNPISDVNIASLKNTNYRITTQTQSVINIPKIFSNWLCFNNGPTFGSLWGGVGWAKEGTVWLINNCFLKDGGGTYIGNYGDGYSGATKTPDDCTNFVMMTGDAVNSYPNSYYVIHNHISNGNIGLPPNPTLISGAQSFWSDESTLGHCEYNIHKCSTQDYYFTDIDPFKDISPSFWQKQDTTFFEARVINMDTKKYKVLEKGIFGNEIAFPVSFSSDVKYPFICNDKNNLFKISESEQPNFSKYNPEWLDIVANAPTRAFISNYARNTLAPFLCKYLGMIPGCRTSSQAESKGETCTKICNHN